MADYKIKFVEPETQDIFNKIINNNNLIDFLKTNGALITPDIYYDYFGNKDPLDEDFIEINNNDTILKLAELLKENDETLQSTSSDLLARNKFLESEIKEIFDFDSTVSLTYNFLKNLYYEYKNSYVDNFFRNNWQKFIPEYDRNKINNNEISKSFIDAQTRIFDKLNVIISNTKDFESYDDIPYEYINYLTQLLGLEQKTFFIKEEQEAQYRILAENILDVYSCKGTFGSFNLLFNFLGFKISIESYYFDRRFYFSNKNEETNTTDNTEYSFYLTTTNPIERVDTNLLEAVTKRTMSYPYSLKTFDSLVKQYGVRCVLGYDTVYLNSTGEAEEYKEKVFKYFKTNYIKIIPSYLSEEDEYKSKNFDQQYVYQIQALASFLVPEFMQPIISSKISTGLDNDVFCINWTHGDNNNQDDQLYILDSEDWLYDVFGSKETDATTYIKQFLDTSVKEESEFKLADSNKGYYTCNMNAPNQHHYLNNNGVNISYSNDINSLNSLGTSVNIGTTDEPKYIYDSNEHYNATYSSSSKQRVEVIQHKLWHNRKVNATLSKYAIDGKDYDTGYYNYDNTVAPKLMIQNLNNYIEIDYGEFEYSDKYIISDKKLDNKYLYNTKDNKFYYISYVQGSEFYYTYKQADLIGKIVKDNDKYYLYDFDEDYLRYSEVADTEDYVFENCNRDYRWNMLNISHEQNSTRPVKLITDAEVDKDINRALIQEISDIFAYDYDNEKTIGVL